MSTILNWHLIYITWPKYYYIFLTPLLSLLFFTHTIFVWCDAALIKKDFWNKKSFFGHKFWNLMKSPTKTHCWNIYSGEGQRGTVLETPYICSLKFKKCLPKNVNKISTPRKIFSERRNIAPQYSLLEKLFNGHAG